MAADPLRQRMHDDVRAVVDRAAEVGGGERVVDEHRNAGGMGDAGDGRNVEHFEIWVTDRLRQDKPGLQPDRSTEAGVVPGRDEGCVDAEAGQCSREEVDGSPIERGRRDDMIASARQRNDGEMHRRHAASRRHGADPALKRGEPFFEDRDGWIRDAAVDVAGALKIEQRCRMFCVAIDVRRRLVDRDGAGAVVWIRPLPSMEGERVKSWGPRSCHINDSAQAHAPARGGTAGAGERGSARRPITTAG